MLFLSILSITTTAVYAQNTDFSVFEAGTEVQLPDSVKADISSDRDAISQILLEWLVADGYLLGEIEFIDSDRADIIRNCAFDLTQMKIQYATGENDSLMIKTPGVRYTQKNLKSEINRLLQNSFQDGYPFGKVSIRTITPDFQNCSVSVHLILDSGNIAIADEIFFSGNDINSQYYLKKISRFQSGETLTPYYLRNLRRNLIASSLFNFVGEGEILLKDHQPVIIFEVQERPVNQFDALIGYVPGATGNGQIAGNLDLSLWNVLMEGSGLNFKYERLQPETSELDINIWQEWISNIPISFSIGFSFYQNDTTYQSRQFEIGGKYRVSGGFKVTGGLGFQNSISGSNIETVLEPDGRKRTARLGFEFSNLDRYDVPTSGNKLSVSYGIGNKEIEGDSVGVIRQNILELEANQYISVLKRSVIALSMQGYLLESDRVTLHDLIRFGGANSFRGYAEEQFRASQLLWGDLEYQFLLDRQSYLFVFGAIGRYHRPALIAEPNNRFRNSNTLYSTGLGLSYQTRLGRLKFTYAISPEESFGNGKVHFGIRTEL